jgi:hypothetical protein
MLLPTYCIHLSTATAQDLIYKTTFKNEKEFQSTIKFETPACFCGCSTPSSGGNNLINLVLILPRYVVYKSRPGTVNCRGIEFYCTLTLFLIFVGNHIDYFLPSAWKQVL